MFHREERDAPLVPTRQPDVSQHDPRVPLDTVKTDGVLSLSLYCQHCSHHCDGAENQRIRTDLQVVINTMINKLISP